jgi:hypothetical protein
MARRKILKTPSVEHRRPSNRSSSPAPTSPRSTQGERVGRVDVPLRSRLQACPVPVRTPSCPPSVLASSDEEEGKARKERGGLGLRRWDRGGLSDYSEPCNALLAERSDGFESDPPPRLSPSSTLPRFPLLSQFEMAVPSSTSATPAKQSPPIQLYHQSSQYRFVSLSHLFPLSCPQLTL